MLRTFLNCSTQQASGLVPAFVERCKILNWKKSWCQGSRERYYIPDRTHRVPDEGRQRVLASFLACSKQLAKKLPSSELASPVRYTSRLDYHRRGTEGGTPNRRLPNIEP